MAYLDPFGVVYGLHFMVYLAPKESRRLECSFVQPGLAS